MSKKKRDENLSWIWRNVKGYKVWCRFVLYVILQEIRSWWNHYVIKNYIIIFLFTFWPECWFLQCFCSHVNNLFWITALQQGLENAKCIMHCCCIIPIPCAELSSSAADEEEDEDQDHSSYQEDGQDHQEEHVAILVLLALERDLLWSAEGGKHEGLDQTGC